MAQKSIFMIFQISQAKPLDKHRKIVYNEYMMRIAHKVIQEADNLSKETGLGFEDCLKICMALLELEGGEDTPKGITERGLVGV